MPTTTDKEIVRNIRAAWDNLDHLLKLYERYFGDVFDPEDPETARIVKAMTDAHLAGQRDLFSEDERDYIEHLARNRAQAVRDPGAGLPGEFKFAMDIVAKLAAIKED